VFTKFAIFSGKHPNFSMVKLIITIIMVKVKVMVLVRAMIFVAEEVVKDQKI